MTIERSTATRCWSRDGLRASVTSRLARNHLAAAFAVTAEHPGEAYDGGRQARYDQGCPIVILLRTAAGDLHTVDVLILHRGAAASPARGRPPQRAFR